MRTCIWYERVFDVLILQIGQVCILYTEETAPFHTPGFNYEVKCGNVGLWTPGTHRGGLNTTS